MGQRADIGAIVPYTSLVAPRPAVRRDAQTPTSRAAMIADDLSDWGEVAVPMAAAGRASTVTAPIPVVAPTRTAPRPTVERVAPNRGAVAPTKVGRAARPATAAGKAKTKAAPPSTAPGKGRRRKAKPRVRRVTRVIRRVDTWSVMKVALGFYITGVIIFLVAGVLLWSVMVQTGTIDNLENFISQLFALDSFSLKGEQLLRGYAVLSAVFVTALLGITVAATVFFNLLSDVTGGIRVTVLEEEVVRVEQPRQ
jgi:Transmembrane domain of unknown function (DUF3566)